MWPQTAWRCWRLLSSYCPCSVLSWPSIFEVSSAARGTATSPSTAALTTLIADHARTLATSTTGITSRRSARKTVKVSHRYNKLSYIEIRKADTLDLYLPIMIIDSLHHYQSYFHCFHCFPRVQYFSATWKFNLWITRCAFGHETKNYDKNYKRLYIYICDISDYDDSEYIEDGDVQTETLFCASLRRFTFANWSLFTRSQSRVTWCIALPFRFLVFTRVDACIREPDRIVGCHRSPLSCATAAAARQRILGSVDFAPDCPYRLPTCERAWWLT